MEEKDKLALAHEWISKLANGINPLNGNVVKEDDVVNNVHISRCLFYVADIVEKYSIRASKSSSNLSRKIPFDSSAIQRENYNYVDAISISAFAREIEKIIPENMHIVSYKSMISWLMQEGFLLETEPDSNGHTYKVPSEKGNSIGIYADSRERNGGHYLVTLYNREAQRFLLENLEIMSYVK